MIYIYDNALVDDLNKAFNPDGNGAVSVVSPENVIQIAAQLEDDKISFPVLAVQRSEDVGIEKSTVNFTKSHSGIATVVDPVTNETYYEKSYPISYDYTLTVLATNTADVDEVMRELIFMYTEMYFLPIRLPYESSRKIRFGVAVDPEYGIKYSSTTSDYLSEGKLHSASIKLLVEGAQLVSYTPVVNKRLDVDLEPCIRTVEEDRE